MLWPQGKLLIPIMNSCITKQWPKISSLFRNLSTLGYQFKDTIYAVSSGHGKCGVAVVRVSGSMSMEIVKTMAKFKSSPKPRYAFHRDIVNPNTSEKLDSGLVLWFPGPHSFTGEDCVEFQVHGGLAVVAAVMRSLNTFADTRHASPGEFTKRAFMNGKLDLTTAEGLADVIHAETEAQRKQALRQMSGDLNALYTRWRQSLIKCTASVEAFIDFSEEENIEDDVIDNVENLLNNVHDEMMQHLNSGRRGERLRDGIHVAIVGKPNVGKSSLLNFLSKRPAAIVSPIEGTTRDLVETSLDLDGYPLVLVDTAGLRLSSDVVEQEGVRRAVSRSRDADLLVIMIDSKDLDMGVSLESQIKDKVSGLLSEQLKLSQLDDRTFMVVVNKVDLLESSSQHNLDEVKTVTLDSSLHARPNDQSYDVPVVYTSLTENAGIDRLLDKLTSCVKSLGGDPLSGNPSFTQARHREHVTNCITNVEAAKSLLRNNVLFAAESLRLACTEMGRLTGVISTEDILDVIFKDFCIGK